MLYAYNGTRASGGFVSKKRDNDSKNGGKKKVTVMNRDNHANAL